MERVFIDDAEIEKMNVRTIVELLNRIPGVSAGESSVSIRGSYMVRVLLDGRPINDPLSSYRAPRWNLISLKNVKDVEIFRGGGVLFGDDSSGGVIRIRTKAIKGVQGSVEALAGSYGTQNYLLNLCYDFGRIRRGSENTDEKKQEVSKSDLPLGVALNAEYYQTDGYRTNNDKDKRRVGAKLSYKPDRRHQFDLLADFAKNEKGMPGLIDYPTPKARQDDNSFDASLLAKSGDVTSGTYYSLSEKEHRNSEINLLTEYESWSVKQEVKAPIDFDSLGRFHAGINLETAQVDGNKIDRQQQEEYGLFASKEIDFKNLPVHTTFGLRWNDYSEYDSALNPEVKAGVKYGKFNFQASVAGTNNTPTFIQRYYESTSTKPNPDLEMERAINYSISVSARPLDILEGSATFFLNKIEDRITYVRGDEGVGNYENFGEVVMKGVDVSVTWKPHPMLAFQPNYIYMIAEDEETGNRLPSKPEHEADLEIHFKPISELNLALDIHFESEQYTTSANTETAPPFCVANLRAEYYWRTRCFYLRVENLLDRDYDIGEGYPGTPFTALIGLRYNFL